MALGLPFAPNVDVDLMVVASLGVADRQVGERGRVLRPKAVGVAIAT